MTAPDVQLSYSSFLSKEPAFKRKIAGFVCGWTAVILLFIASAGAFFHTGPFQAIGGIGLVTAIPAMIYLTPFTIRHLTEMFAQYILEFTDRELRLWISIPMAGYRLLTRMPLREVAYVEYSPQRNPALLFHGVDGRVAGMPVWAASNNPEAIVKFLRDRHIRLVLNTRRGSC